MSDSRYAAPLVALFEMVFAPWKRFRLAGIHVAAASAEPLPADFAVLLVANHVSWWDGFLLREVQRRLRPGVPMFTVMDAAQLARFPFFRFMGAIGVVPGSVSSTRALMREVASLRSRYGRELVLSLFPQGRIWPSTRRPLDFRAGVGRVAAALAPVAIVPVGLHLEPLTNAAPHAFALIGKPILHHAGDADTREIEQAVGGLLDALRSYLEREGESAARHWPPAEDATGQFLPLSVRFSP